ncbi:TRAP transporter small permease [Acetomicrobium sp.]|jgi:TRAP-type C4-dicarboxylate transport system permease small subunit|uniref:TRAP transporter small permease n=1 Tax=Acetomicrobium sp. TaxID=1872099 RepID=UPI002FCC71AA
MAGGATTRAKPTRSVIVRVSDGIEIVLDRFLIPLTLGGLSVVVFFQVINRFILHISAAWTEEIGRYLFVWTSLLGAVSGIRKMAHLNVEFVQNAVGIKFKYILMIVSDILSLLFFVILAHKGMLWAVTSGFRVLADSVDIPMFYIQVIVPVCAILMTIFTVEHIYCTISKFKEKRDR